MPPITTVYSTDCRLGSAGQSAFKVADLVSKTPLATANDRLSRAGCRVTDYSTSKMVKLTRSGLPARGWL